MRKRPGEGEILSMKRSFIYDGNTVSREGDIFVSRAVGDDYPVEVQSDCLQRLLQGLDEIAAIDPLVPASVPSWFQDCWDNGTLRSVIPPAPNLRKLFSIDELLPVDAGRAAAFMLATLALAAFGCVNVVNDGLMEIGVAAAGLV
jgi:hypothetical protein